MHFQRGSMAELNRAVFVATDNNEGGYALRSLPQLSGGRDITHVIPCRFGAAYEYFKGAFIFDKMTLLRAIGTNNKMLSVLYAGNVFIIGGGDGYSMLNSVGVLNLTTGRISSAAPMLHA